MNEQDKNKQQNEEAPKLSRGASAVKTSGWKRMLSKKWVSPAAFMAAAAIIVTLMWVYQGSDNKAATTQNSESTVDGSAIGESADADSKNDDTLEVIAGDEALQWPVVNKDELVVALPFYEAEASSEERQKAMLVSGTTFTPHMGIDFTKADNSAFDVIAAMSGEVTLAEEHPTNGYNVEITHPNGLVTIYQSLSEIAVEQGDQVKQGTIIAKAGRNELEKDLGVHLHFEVREDGKPINPNVLLDEQ